MTFNSNVQATSYFIQLVQLVCVLITGLLGGEPLGGLLLFPDVSNGDIN